MNPNSAPRVDAFASSALPRQQTGGAGTEKRVFPFLGSLALYWDAWEHSPGTSPWIAMQFLSGRMLLHCWRDGCGVPVLLSGVKLFHFHHHALDQDAIRAGSPRVCSSLACLRMQSVACR